MGWEKIFFPFTNSNGNDIQQYSTQKHTNILFLN
jgi:hypothetical protein